MEQKKRTFCQNFQDVCQNWKNNNIYDFRKSDGMLYLFFYILVPISVTALTLYFFPSQTNSAVYCYITILISALNCIYDAINRWENGVSSVTNIKLFLLGFSLIVISSYCFFEIICILISNNINYRCDYILLSYLLNVVIAAIDISACFASEMAIKSHIGKTILEESK